MSQISDTLDHAATIIDTTLAHILEETQKYFSDIAGFPVEFLDSLYASVNGGKRFRALSALVGASVTVDGDFDRAINVKHMNHLTTALEFYQAAALIHDDVVDHSPTRRGRPSAHRLFAHAHDDEAWLGSSDTFGEGSAILLGDFLLACAEREMTYCPAKVAEHFASMAGEVALGQYLDLRSAQQEPQGDSEALELAHTIIRLKSARYSVAHPVSLGAQLAGAPDETVQQLLNAFEPIGIAFQLRDDHLGVFGQLGDTGKPSGGDIIERKRTALLSLTLAHAPDHVSDTIRSIYRQDTLSTGDVEAVTEFVDVYGRDPHEVLIERFYAQGISVIEKMHLPSHARKLCEEFAHQLVWRTQ